ncbi:hypothetical protein BH11MYX1_BH11MYX1_19820 [soil metagenome]
MKSFLTCALVTVLASSAFAGKPTSTTTKKPKCGENYELAPRTSATPTETTRVEKKGLSESQVANVVKSRLADVRDCWAKLPSGQRRDAMALLQLAIDETGEVQTVGVVGAAVPGDAQRCIATRAGAWKFPAADRAGAYEYGVQLRAL